MFSEIELAEMKRSDLVEDACHALSVFQETLGGREWGEFSQVDKENWKAFSQVDKENWELVFAQDRVVTRLVHEDRVRRVKASVHKFFTKVRAWFICSS